MFDEDDLLALSALQHLAYCERRAALILLEAVWADNAHTAQGTRSHRKVHAGPSTESRGDLRIARGLWLHSLEHGLVGVADVVEFHRVAESETGSSIRLPGVPHRWVPFPVEYKSGARRHECGYEQQLCAQALCLEEMLNVPVPCGALFYGKSFSRQDVAFTPALRHATIAAAARLHDLVSAGRTPPPVAGPRCKNCSLVDLCLPRTAALDSAQHYLARVLQQDSPGDPPP